MNELNNEYDFWCNITRQRLPSSGLQGKIITDVTLYVKNKKWIWNKTFEKWKKEANDPLQPDKKAQDTMYISKHRNKIIMRYKQPMMVNSETGKLEEYYQN